MRFLKIKICKGIKKIAVFLTQAFCYVDSQNLGQFKFSREAAYYKIL